VEFEICTLVSYKQSGNYPTQDYLLQKEVTKQMCEGIPDLESIYQSCSDILSSGNATSLANALKHCSNVENLYLTGVYNSIKTASTLRDVIKITTKLSM